jgi:eukaryotic-like serine/threonine-protein kinase
MSGFAPRIRLIKKMMNPSKEIEKALFDAVRDVEDVETRTVILDQACGQDLGLRTRIEELLEVQKTAEAFFDTDRRSETATAADGLDTRRAAELNDLAGKSATNDVSDMRIGRYKLIQRMGEGGCGVVYLAEQEKPVRRRVALKIIRLGMDTESVIARFGAEQQALALMDHPNIARVLDAGATETGRPYFVMELVRGVKITEYCNTHRVGIRQRLQSFIQVCHAIQHAHQKGVIHRDIKPSNILVTLHNGSAMPKVIDFGIAKAIEGRLTEDTIFTTYGQFIGTPAYMSPEQAGVNGLDVDTRSDVYSLGVLIYELLTDKTPFDSKMLLQAGVDETRRILKEKEPTRPSNLLRTLDPEELLRIAACRQEEPEKLISLLKGDLDWIVMKALEKDRSRRYETVNGLAMDIERYLNNEPVIARPPSRAYRLKKLMLRNRGVFISGLLAAVVLIAGLGTSTWFFFKERELRQEAERGRVTEQLLRQQAEIQAKVSQAAALVGQNNFEDADRLLAGTSFPGNASEGEGVFRPLGDWAAVQGRWHQAAQYLTRLVQVDRTETWDLATLDNTRCAVALVKIDDTEGYNRLRDEAIAQFASTQDPVVAERTVKNSLLLPADGKTLAELGPLATLAEKSIPDANSTAESEPWGGAIAWRCVSLALMDYRQGHYAEAVSWGQRCLSYGNDNMARVATIHAILAMAYYQMGQTENAHAELVQSSEIIGSKLHNGLDAGNGGEGYWFDWEVGSILQLEASGLMGDSPSNM